MSLLANIDGPDDVKGIPRDQLPQLAAEIRQRLVDVVSITGGHIGAGLGVVELTIALLYVFDSPHDRIVWDVGHQGYPWKLLTGRNAVFPTLRQKDGISGFLRRIESPHDWFGAGHAATGISAAFGIATGRDLKGESYHVVVVVGDGALTCGLAYEGLNNAGHSGRDFLVVVNDNGMSISPNVGAISRYLRSVATTPIYNRVRDELKAVTEKVSAIFGHGVHDFARRLEESLKNLFVPGMLFEELGLRYFGPVDGHDVNALVDALSAVSKLKGPRVLHVLTEKGKGFAFAEANREKWHGLAAFDPATGEARKKSDAVSWTQVFGQGLTQIAETRRDVVAITAAMPSGTGTAIFQKAHPERFFDVGIAEAHGVTFAAGLATQGLRPVAAIYSTFLQRGYDSIIHDVALQHLPVIFAMDRAGLVGEDGPTHMGLYDIAYMLAVPGMTVTAPKDGAELIGLLKTALDHTSGPFCTRYPRDNAPDKPPHADRIPPVPYGTWEVLRAGREVALLAVGALVLPALQAAELLEAEGFDLTVVNCRFLKPHDEATLHDLLGEHRVLVTLEDATVGNGFGAYLTEVVAAQAPEARVLRVGVPDRLIDQAPRAVQLAELGLDAEGIAARLRAQRTVEALAAPAAP